MSVTTMTKAFWNILQITKELVPKQVKMFQNPEILDLEELFKKQNYKWNSPKLTVSYLNICKQDTL